MGRYILGRLVSLLFVLILVSMITFTIMHLVPGGPFDERNQRLPDAAKANILRKYGLDQPVWKQYLKYMGSLMQGDLGIPFQDPTNTVANLIADKWKVTAHVGLLTIFFSFGLGLLTGIYTAFKQNTWIDSFVTFFSMIGMTIPSFVVAMWLLLLFSSQLNWLPSGGWSEPENWLIPGLFSKDWILPVLAYSLIPFSQMTRYTRTSIIEVMNADYVRTAHAKGALQRVVVSRHILRNALIPIVTAMGPEIPNLLTGSIFIEAIFRIPGLGKYFVTSTYNRDYPMIMALVLLIAAFWGITYLVTDILYTLIDPRVRINAKG